MKIPIFEFLKKTASDVSLYYQIVSQSFYDQKASKFFACDGHSLAHQGTISIEFAALKSLDENPSF